MAASRADLPYMLRRKSRAGKRAALRLQKVLERLRVALNDPELPDDLRLIWTPHNIESETGRHTPFERFLPPMADAWMAAWIGRVADAQRRKPFSFKLDHQVKLSAAIEAHSLMEQFQQKISAKKGSAYCRLAALLYGKPDASLEHVCRNVRSGRVRLSGKK
jgi:hypothetical protein